MKPYYDHDGITLYRGDAREIVPALGSAIADCALADPPYAETALRWDRWPDGWPATLDRALRPNATFWCFGSLRMFMHRSDEFAGWRVAQEVVWEKHNGTSFHADRFKRVHELAVQFFRQCDRWTDTYKCPQFTRDALRRSSRRTFSPAHTGSIGASEYTSEDCGPRMMRSVLQVRSCHGYAVHPTQKPLGILSPLMEFSCPPGGTVLVPFAGGGSELEAAKQSGRCAIGVEADEAYCDIIVRRLEQGMLFNPNGVAK